MEYIEKTLEFPDDYEGRVVATLIQTEPETPVEGGRAVLYIHGYIDYFFQTHMAEAFEQAGYRFYAVDLRKCGRSLLPHQHLNYCRDLREYYPEIDASIEAIRAAGHSGIVLLGHSTGGLVASLYCAEDGKGGKNRKYIGRLILNSPFLEFNTSWLTKRVLIPVVGQIGRVFPYAWTKNQLSPGYAASVHRSMKGEWDYDLAWKPADGVPLYLAWLRAVRKGQLRVKRGLGIRIPVLVMHAGRSSWERKWSDILMKTDAVLNVADIKKYASRLAPEVVMAEIRDGMHDLVLSGKAVREKVFGTMFGWLRGK